MDTFAPLAALTATVFVVISLLRYARGRDWNGVFTIVSVWVAGIAVLALFAQSNWAEHIDLAGLTGGVPLAELNFASLIILGLQLGSTATAFNELRGAIDSSTSTAKPSLLEGETAAQRE